MSDLIACFDILIKLVSPIVTWSLVVAGWEIIGRQQDQREHIKFLASSAQDVRQRVRRLAEDAAEFHMKERFEPKHAHLLLRTLKQIASDITVLGKAHLAGENYLGAIVSLRQAVTGSNFSEASFSQRSADDLTVRSIEISADGLDFLLARSINAKLLGGVQRLSIWNVALSMFSSSSPTNR